MYLEITQFGSSYLSGTSAGTQRQMMSMRETAEVVSRVTILENGAKFDADLTTAADVALGIVVATFRIRITSGTLGLTGLNTQLGYYTALRGTVGTLTGIARSTIDSTWTCTARCVNVEEEELTYQMVTGSGKVNATTLVTVTWEKKTAWAGS